MRWRRFREDESRYWRNHEEWPAGDDVRAILVYNSCDGFHIWNRSFDTPPGTHWRHLPARPKRP